LKSKLSVLFIGDVVGDPGISILKKELSGLIDKFKAEFVIINGENACGGKGITEEEAKVFFELGAHVITTGNHVWDNWRAKPLLASNANIVRPLNYPSGNAGKGFLLYKLNEEITVGVLQLQGRTFMQAIDCPFKAADFGLKHLSEKTQFIIVDFHADATAEKYSMAWYLDGKVSALLGTHTHIPTADACILPNGTAYITDVGMTGPYDSVVGLKKEIAMKRFLLQTPHKYEIAEKDVRICGVHLEIETSTGQAIKIEQIIYPDFEREVNFTANY
jgi:2',3'-cyclic-nucleotide 2'-phosphodiesterase